MVNVTNSSAEVVRWNLGRDFRVIVKGTPKLTEEEEEEKTTKAENILYQNGDGYVIFPLSGDVLRVKIDGGSRPSMVK